MSITLITDGMLYPIFTVPALAAPQDTEGYIDPVPVTPCAVQGELTDPPPVTPVRVAAAGPEVPVIPCGTTGYDPTINPPAVPEAPEASEDPGHTAPAVPKCPEGRKQ